jgi:hypothetical protein
MRTARLVCFRVAFGCPALGGTVYRYNVKRGSELEKELGYKREVWKGRLIVNYVQSRATALGELQATHLPLPSKDYRRGGQSLKFLKFVATPKSRLRRK